MGAAVPYLVRVTVATETVIEVVALTETEARERALALPDVLSVIGVEPPAQTWVRSE